MNFDDIGLHVPTLLLPKAGVDLSRWAVIACDQYTSDAAYWASVEAFVDGYPSTLQLILPEIHLEATDKEDRIRAIQQKMRQYLADGTLRPEKPGFVLVDRQTCRAKSRKGLVVALDLERYDYREGSKTLIRATEGTILERLPPRMQIRENAEIELPHIMVLINDPEKTVIEPLFEQAHEPLYDAALMMNGGRVKGYPIDDAGQIQAVADGLRRLAGVGRAGESYGGEVLLYALGDGNHSFATAKSLWEKIKTDPNTPPDHPARYALVELVNLYDDGLEFEPIHRVVFNTGLETLLVGMARYCQAQGVGFSHQGCQTLEEAKGIAARQDPQQRHGIAFAAGGRFGVVFVEQPRYTLEVATLQGFLDDYRKHHPKAAIDYIHGDDALLALSAQPRATGFFLPALSKYQLFKTIEADGALPRKTFSMGEADEKRFYLECRKITP